MTEQQSKWNADAEAAMMGFTIHVQSEEHLKHLVGYVIHTLGSQYRFGEEEKTNEVVDNAINKYNSGEDKSVTWFTCNSTDFGVLLTFVRDKGTPTKREGVLAWVENLDAPDCSELGYVFFDNVKGKVRRVS